MATSWGPCRSPHILILGSQHIVPHWGSCERPDEGELGTHACAQWVLPHERSERTGHPCPSWMGTHANIKIMHGLTGHSRMTYVGASR